MIRDSFLMVLVCLGLFLAAILAVAISQHTLALWACSDYGETAGYPSRVVGLDTCTVEHPDLGWLTYEELVAARAAEKGLRETF